GVMDNNGQILFWSAARSATGNELQIGQQVTDAFNQLAGNISTPDPATLAAPGIPIPEPDTLEPTEQCRSSITHVVEPNETLFRIALRYGTSVDAIVAANNIPNRDAINPGQVLAIPCGVDSSANSSTPGQSGAVATPFDCSAGIPAGLPPNLQSA